MTHRGGVRAEVAVLARALRRPAPWLLLLRWMVLGSLAYGVPLRYALDIGG